MARARRRQARPRDDARADARGCVRRARHRSRAGGSGMSQLLRTMTLGWKLHFKQESRNPFFLYIVDRHAADLRDDGVLPLPGRREAGDASSRLRVGSAMMGIWSLTTTAAAARVAAAAAARDRSSSSSPRRRPSGPPSCRSRSRSPSIGIYSLATGLLYVRVPLRRARLGRRLAARSSSPCPPTILSIGLLGFLMALGLRPLPRGVDGRQPVRVPGLDRSAASSIPLALLPELGRAGRVGARADLGDERAPRTRRSATARPGPTSGCACCCRSSTPCSAGCC